MATRWTLLLVFLCFRHSSCQAEESNDLIRVVIGFDSTQDQESFFNKTIAYFDERPSLSATKQRNYKFRRSNAMAMNIHLSQWEDLAQDPRVSYIQRDSRFQLLQKTEEVIPYGIEAVQGTSTSVPPPFYTESDCANPNSFKVCVVDSGLLIGHRDIPYSLSSAGIRGEEFGIDSPWYQPSAASFHGTHVTGTILAKGNNGVGVVGVVPDSQGICLLVARTFDDQNSQDGSFIAEAVEWCGDQGARVINMSLGSTERLTRSEIEVYERLYNFENVLIIAAAGNQGDSVLTYPASLDVVISVAATTEELTKATFSQFNNQVDIAGPGVNILSTTSSNAVLLNTPNILVDAALMQYSPNAPDDLLETPLAMVDCQQGFELCVNAANKACVIERGSSFFWQKALNCQNAGGLAAFVYNNLDDVYAGSLTEGTVGVGIPTYAVSRSDGLIMLENVNTSSMSLQAASASYGVLDGTSMAAPHVSGVATKIWAARPACTNLQIREALEQSAFDLGPAGKDVFFGYGLVQAQAAFDYLVTNFEAPCGGEGLDSELNEGQCLENYAFCSSDDSCCSGRCVPVSVNGPTICRATVKDTRTKISTSRGGAATATFNDGGRGRHLANLPRVRGSKSIRTSQAQREIEEHQNSPKTISHGEIEHPASASFRSFQGIVTR